MSFLTQLEIEENLIPMVDKNPISDPTIRQSMLNKFCNDLIVYREGLPCGYDPNKMFIGASIDEQIRLERDRIEIKVNFVQYIKEKNVNEILKAQTLLLNALKN